MKAPTYFINKKAGAAGSVFLEAALVLPVILTLVAFAFDIGSWFYTRGLLADATAHAARKSAVVVASYLDLNPQTSNPQLTGDYVDRDGNHHSAYNCSTVAAWAQAISEDLIRTRLGSVEGVTTTVSFNNIQPQPVLKIRVVRPFRCLWCLGVLGGNLFSESAASIEDVDMVRCPGSETTTTLGCSPSDRNSCR